MFNGEKVRTYSSIGNPALTMENKGKKLQCPYGTTGRLREQSSPKEKILISATKHKEIKITVYIANKDNINMLLNSFSCMSKNNITSNQHSGGFGQYMTVSVFVKRGKAGDAETQITLFTFCSNS